MFFQSLLFGSNANEWNGDLTRAKLVGGSSKVPVKNDSQKSSVSKLDFKYRGKQQHALLHSHSLVVDSIDGSFQKTKNLKSHLETKGRLDLGTRSANIVLSPKSNL